MAGEMAHIKVSLPEQIRHLDPNIVMIVSVNNQEFQKEIITELRYLGIPADRIILFPYLYNDYPNTYFYHPFWKWGLEEVFVDCGCFDGNTSRQFINLAERLENMSIAKIIAYEPDEMSFSVCEQNLADIPSFIIKNVGLWNKCETLRFSATGKDGSRIAPTGNVEINTVALDEDLLDQKVTFIKMDIEGAELNALKGAEKLIRSQRPKLAISVYHMAEDILSVPEFIINLKLNYKLYLRHQETNFFETVFYAVPQ
jgi:FkbM family methyltransferase